MNRIVAVVVAVVIVEGAVAGAVAVAAAVAVVAVGRAGTGVEFLCLVDRGVRVATAGE